MEGVTFGYSPDHILLRDVDFGLHLSSRVSIVGPNGVGKSTLVKLIEGGDASHNDCCTCLQVPTAPQCFLKLLLIFHNSI